MGLNCSEVKMNVEKTTYTSNKIPLESSFMPNL